MTRQTKIHTGAMFAVLALVLTGALLGPAEVRAQSNADYTSTPPFISSVVTPNILILMDNSGSMTNRACESSSCGKLPDGSTSTVTTFVATTTYSGLFDSMKCYTYDGTNTRFAVSTTKAALNSACLATEWDGNLLNWATFRRFDAVKKAMIGGDCLANRAADGTCPPTAGQITIQGDTVFDSTSRGHEITPAIPNSGADSYLNRIPNSTAQGGTGSNPANLYIHLRGGQSGMQGTFCVDNDNAVMSNTATACNSGDIDAFVESNFRIRIAVSSEPTGVVQQVGNKARFGLLVFKGAGDGGRMLTGVGSRQSIDFAGSSVETFNTNTAAMIDSVEESFATTWTPLAESLYDATRYVAQINSTFTPTVYTYPIAFAGGNSNGVAYQATGVGSIGGSEVSALTGSETCPAGYIASACGRDPYFYGSNHTPAWASPSAQVNCCRTFIIIFTDGEPTQDTNIPAALQDYAHGLHGLHCTGGSGTIHAPDGTCNTNNATPPATLLGEHKTDGADNRRHYLDDVAYWAHINDLRPGYAGDTYPASSNANIAVINEAGHPLQGFQNVTVYSFFAFGNIAGREILMQTAKMGAFEDIPPSPIPGGYVPVPDAGEWDKENNYTGVATPDGLPDAYFESSNVDDLQDKMLATISSILRKSTSGTSISVLATSSTGEGALYQAYFYPNTLEPSTLSDIKWTGYTQGLFLDSFGNMREDTNQDGRLVYNQDKIIKTRLDTGTGDVKVDKYLDSNGDGKADNTVADEPNLVLGSIVPIWEGGKQLALMASASRKILTWVDSDNDGLVDVGEQIPFSTANSATLAPYLRAGAAPYTADNIINFIRGDQIAGLRDRQLQVPAGSGTLKVWKLGDPVHSTPTVVSGPKERYDVIYGDASYTAFFQQYRNRRQVAYVGANDGMLHALNVGFYHRGDDPTTTTVTEHGWFTRTPTDNSSGALLGDELWGFIPYQLLPQLQWLARADYQHVYYVDLKPKVTDARIFTPDADHPNGWGTILIGGFRLGGSCGACVAGTGAPPLSVTANFGSGVQTRYFYTAYFVLDITNPEADPKLLWVFTDAGQGLSTSYPAVVRVNPTADTKTDNTNAKWFMVVGSGMTGYNGSITQSAKLYAINLVTGPGGTSNSLVTTMPVGSWNSWMGDLITLDRDLDYRTDAAYVGRSIDDGSLPWRGKMYRLTTSGCSTAPCATTTWGIASGPNRVPTEVLDTFPTGFTTEPGPIVTAPAVTVDDANKVWIFFGTGRYYSAADKINTDTQYFFGVKDSVLNNTCTGGQTSVTSCLDDDLVNVSAATICTVCTGNQVTGVTGVTTFDGGGASSLVGLIQTKDGWYTTMPNARERVLVSPTLLGGIVFFPSFIPTNDICKATGDGRLYALFYLTGSAYKESVIGTATSGGNTNVLSSISLGTGTGLASQLAVHIGSEGSGGAGTSGSGSGCAGGVTGFLQSSTGTLSQYCGKTALSVTSRYISWINQRD